MNIIIPIGGKGERFKNAGYNVPKPFIPIYNKEMIFHVLDNLQFTKNDNVFIIYYNIYNFKQIIHKKYPKITCIEINKQTDGAAETILLGLEIIKQQTPYKKTLLLDCDTFYTENVIEKFRRCETNAVFYTHNNISKPIFSYIQMNDDDIIKIAEKNKISDNANTGIYCFTDIDELYLYAKQVVVENWRFNNEYYISCIIDRMINNKHRFVGIKLEPQFVFNLGTPEQVKQYIDNTYLFLFDLDGTLVLTENIYYNIWETILKQYNIVLTERIFKNSIVSNSDTIIIKELIPTKYNTIIDNITKQKDELFLQNINKVKIISGAREFIEKIHNLGHKIAIVTNCNRSAVVEIIRFLQLDTFIENIIIGDECSQPKPYPEPYRVAIQSFCDIYTKKNNSNINNNKVIIFEDSKTGLLSAKGVNPSCIVGLETSYSREELKNNFANITIPNFENVELCEILNYNIVNDNMEIFAKQIKESLPINNKKNIDVIFKNGNKLKGGFICDVLEIKITYEDANNNNNNTQKKECDCIIKIENKNSNFLTDVSHKLDLYNREYYFYDVISKHVPVNIPFFYGIAYDNEYNKMGIVMENLITKGYKINLDLNKEPLQTSLNIIDAISKMHVKFWNKPIQNYFTKLKKNNGDIYKPFWNEFIVNKWSEFKTRWNNVLNQEQIEISEKIVRDFNIIQDDLSDTNLTLIHGDMKSANMFYNGDVPYFIDWQYIAQGKGVQDLVFFMIESFDIITIKKYKTLFKEYYNNKILESGIIYNRDDYERDFLYASYYFPFFVSIWFGTINVDELIDKNFPFFFIQRLYHFYSL